MSARLILHKDCYEIEYDDKSEFVKHEPDKYSFNKLPINIKLKKIIGNLYIQKGNITKVYLGLDKWCILDTDVFNKLRVNGYGKLRLGVKYKCCGDVRLNKNKYRYSLSRIIFPVGITNLTCILHLNGNKFDFRKSNCRLVPKWISSIYNIYKFRRNNFGCIVKLQSGKNTYKYFKYHIRSIEKEERIYKTTKEVRSKIIKEKFVPILNKFGLIKEGGKCL